MEFRIIIPAEHAQRVVDAISARYGYTGTAPDGTAQTKQQFVRERLRQWLRDEVRAHEESEAAAKAARDVAALPI